VDSAAQETVSDTFGGGDKLTNQSLVVAVQRRKGQHAELTPEGAQHSGA
jgi:hypothetical protein